jgi:hypothetical protein
VGAKAHFSGGKGIGKVKTEYGKGEWKIEKEKGKEKGKAPCWLSYR